MTTSKLIFLDCDGVICLPQDFKRVGEFNYINPGLANRVKEILIETGAKLVLSSTWRKFQDDDHAYKVLKCFGKDAFWYSDDFEASCTPYDYTKWKLRGDEVKAWLEKHVVSNGLEFRYLILDDDSDFLPEQMPYHIKTNTFQGITEVQKERAIELLKGH